MAEAIVITAALRDEIAADLKAGGERAARWRQPSPHPVVVLARGEDAWPIGWVGTLTDITDYSGAVTASSQPHPAAATAWAPVGGVDGGPRPDIGDRILVLADEGGDCPEPWIGHVTYAAWGNLPIGAVMSGGVTPLAAQESAVTRWAILPPEVPTEPTPGEASTPDDMYELTIRIPMTTFTRTAPNEDPRVDQLIDHAMDLFPDADVTGGRQPAWPEDGPTECPTCGAVDRAERRHRAHVDADTTLRELVRWLTTERERLHTEHRRDREPGPMIEARTLRIVLDQLRGQGFDVDYLAEPPAQEATDA